MLHKSHIWYDRYFLRWMMQCSFGVVFGPFGKDELGAWLTRLAKTSEPT